MLLRSVFGAPSKVLRQLKPAKIVRPFGRLLTPRRTNLTIVVGLNLNVITPANVKPGSKLPVVVVCILPMECLWNVVTLLIIL
jgi:hypothetical protein